MKVYLNNKILDFLGNISSDIIIIINLELCYSVFMSFIWAILIPLLMIYYKFIF